MRWLQITLFFAILYKISAAVPTCLVKPNSTDVPGYYEFYAWYFTPTPAILGGRIDPWEEENVTNAICANFCNNTEFGFYVHILPVYVGGTKCFCLTSAPDYSVAYLPGDAVMFSKICPKYAEIAVPPAKVPPPTRPPPPAKPSGCPLAFNSSNPSGYFYYEKSSGDSRVVLNITDVFDAWPVGAIVCEKVCKAYPEGFVIGDNKYVLDQDCYCLKSPVNYDLFEEYGVSFFSYFYIKSCPVKSVSPPPPRKLRGRHPPGVGKHPPGVGKPPLGVGKHPPRVGKHPPGVGKHPPGVGKHSRGQ